MSISTAAVRRRLTFNTILVTLSIVTAVLAGLPLFAGIANETFGDGTGASTPFATAAPGQYAVFTTAHDTSDEIRVAPAEDPAAAITIASVDHLPGFISRGAVSPDGTRLALVTVDAGRVTAPGASLLVLDLESGDLTRAAIDIDHTQTPVWTPDSDAVIVTRGGDAESGDITVHRIDASADGETPLHSHAGVLGAYPVGYDGDGRLVSVVIDGNGSHIYRDGDHVTTISDNITRDWTLSPGGDELAYIETDTGQGTRYLPHTVSLDDGAGVLAQSLAPDNEALGSAWSPAGAEFGHEPPVASDSDSAFAQTLDSGFDVPLAYSPDGAHVAVEHWTGSSFSDPGTVSFEIVSADTRQPLPDATRFYGWSER